MHDSTGAVVWRYPIFIGEIVEFGRHLHDQVFRHKSGDGLERRSVKLRPYSFFDNAVVPLSLRDMLLRRGKVEVQRREELL